MASLSEPLVLAVAGLLAVCLLLALMLWRQTRRRRLAEQEVDSLAGQVGTLREALGAGRDGYFLWFHQTNEAVCSRRLSVLLGLPAGMASAIGDVVAEVADDARPALDQAIERLRHDGTPFTLAVAYGPARRRLEFKGTRVFNTDDHRSLADVLWVRDVTDDGRAVDRLSSETTHLRTISERLRATLDALPCPVWVRDDDLSIVLCNESYARAVEAANSTAAVEQGLDLASGETGRELRALAARSRAAGVPLSDRFHLVIEGTRRLMEVTEALFREPAEDGTDRLTVGIARDISTQEDLENRLAGEQANQAVVLEHLSTAIAIFGPATRLTYHNPAFARLWHLDGAWLRETQPSYGDLLDVLRDRRALPEVADYPAFKAAEVDRFTSLIEPMEDLVHLPDGKALRRVIAPQPLGGLLLTYEDVTDKLTLERSFNTLSAVQRETLDHLHEAVGVFGADGRLKLANPAFATLWGETAASIEAPPQISEFLDLLRDRFADESGWRHHRFAVLTPPSQRTPHRGRVSLVGGPVLDYACVPLPDGGVLLSYNDVSDTARVERALRERAQSLSEASMLRADFIASLSYELRTPMTTITGFSEMLCAEYHGQLNAQQFEYAQSIAETARELVLILNDIADLVTIEAGRSALDVDAFDFQAAVKAVVAQCREATRRRAVAIDLACQEDIGWMVGDEERIKRILFHLVNGAIKVSPAGTTVGIAVERLPDAAGDETVALTVSDESGESAGRTLSTGSETLSGGNLAMLLVRRFAEMHGGSIVMTAKPGIGTSVTCHLPSGRIAPNGALASSSEASPGPRGETFDRII
ncbi:PAS domain-containing sensor histidine kinase [uncultured Rhodospira sp.]|uniref:PAS domain-containing sensor histidine kinase n=1 Tax=uncultured Rhodospira sp. TaxID=1936189 RepID=UPI00261A44C3|nr:PAS domain-containing sensor histidine kinase [uncultured Rhodospira sp.]